MREELTLSDENNLDNVSKTSAISSWSGFIYQGKVGLYHAIRLLVSNNSNKDLSMKFEHLDDFAVFDSKGGALSIHQVKAKQATTRGSYTKALKKISEVTHDSLTTETKRYFHVSKQLDDDSDFEEDGKKVAFYEYNDKKTYAQLNNIDFLIESMIRRYLEENNLSETEHLINFKLDKLHSIVLSKVNYAHYINQFTSSTQFESADKNPILFSEIVDTLNNECINLDDVDYLLERFRNKILIVIDNMIDDQIEENSSESNELCIPLMLCRQVITSLDKNLVEKLYYSLDPKRIRINPEEGSNDITRYLDIITEIPKFIYENNVPHYVCKKYRKYLPSSIEVGGNLSRKNAIRVLKSNIDSMRKNNTLLQVLFEFDCLVVRMNNTYFSLDGIDKMGSKFTHNNNSDYDLEINYDVDFSNKITKAKKIGFISIEDSKGELCD